jgi:hypothetical protein
MKVTKYKHYVFSYLLEPNIAIWFLLNSKNYFILEFNFTFWLYFASLKKG